MYSLGSLVNVALMPEVFDQECKTMDREVKKYMRLEQMRKNFKKSNHAR